MASGFNTDLPVSKNASAAKVTFSASINFYEVHYASHHLVGTSGGNTEDLREALAMMADGRLDPVAMITHVGGLDAVPVAAGLLHLAAVGQPGARDRIRGEAARMGLREGLDFFAVA